MSDTAPAPVSSPPAGPPWWRGFLRPLDLLLILVPAAAVLKYGGFGPVWVFAAAGLGIVPLAGWMGRATEALADRLGSGVGGLLNATFGNAAELIIALMVLRRGPDLYPVVKATITGSIIGNLLLVLGAAVVAGGVKFSTQRFNKTAAGAGATLLALACAGLIVPTLFFYLPPVSGQPANPEVRRIENLSEEIAVVLMAVYGLSLLFTLRTHKHLFGEDPDAPDATGTPATSPAEGADEERPMGPAAAVGLMAVAVAGVAVLSEWLVGAVEPAAHALGMNAVFVGVIVVAVVGNAAEHSTAVLVAVRGKMGLAVQIAVGSSIQVALFVAPVLVFASLFFGHSHPLDLHFTPLEVAAVVLAVAVTTLVSHDGETNWLEGAMLLALYLILGFAFYHLPGAAH